MYVGKIGGGFMIEIKCRTCGELALFDDVGQVDGKGPFFQVYVCKHGHETKVWGGAGGANAPPKNEPGKKRAIRERLEVLKRFNQLLDEAGVK